MQAFEIAAESIVPSDGGSALALSGDRLAVSSATRLVVWQAGRRVVTVDAAAPSPGVPRFLGGDLVGFGPGVVDLVSGVHALRARPSPDAPPAGGERAVSFAWSGDGRRFVGSFGTSDRSRQSRIDLFDGATGERLRSLGSGSELAPEAMWLGPDAAVLGFPDPIVYDAYGRRVATIALDGATIAHVDGSSDGRRILVVDVNRTLAWVDGSTWKILDRWDGPWAYGAVSPDGRLAAGLAIGGSIVLARVDADRFAPIGPVAHRPEAGVVALGDGRIATAGAGLLWHATLVAEA